MSLCTSRVRHAESSPIRRQTIAISRSDASPTTAPVRSAVAGHRTCGGRIAVRRPPCSSTPCQRCRCSQLKGEGASSPPVSKSSSRRCSCSRDGFDINRIILVRILATLVLLLFLWLALRKATLVPGRIQSVVEMAFDFVRKDIAYGMLGEKDGDRFFPLIASLFFGILALNVTGIVPSSEHLVQRTHRHAAGHGARRLRRDDRRGHQGQGRPRVPQG